jgi:hypothetical protein
MKPIIDKSAKYDLIITPQLYMMKRDSLPIKYSFQAKKIAPSILDEFAKDEELEYQVFKEEPKDPDEEQESISEWTFIGYNRETLEHLLLEKGLNPENIGRFYFAQQFKEQLEDRLLLMSQKEALTVIDNIVTIVPRNFIDNKNIVFLENLIRPKKSFSFRFKTISKSNIDANLALKLAIAFGIFGTAFWIDGINSNRQIIELDNRLGDKFAKYPSLQSSITRRNIYSKYSKIDKEQRGIREFLKAIGKVVTIDSKVDSLDIEKNRAEATIKIKNGKISKIKSIAKRSGLKVTTKSSDTIIVKKGNR